MTAPDMNALRRKITAVLFALTASGGLAACAGAFDPVADARSAVAPRVEAMVDANRTYPVWAAFPQSLEPLPEPAVIAAQVNTLGVSGGALAGDVSRIDWQITEDPAAFAATVQARIDAVPVAPVTQETQAEIDEFVRRTRDRGRAPPPVDRR